MSNVTKLNLNGTTYNLGGGGSGSTEPSELTFIDVQTIEVNDYERIIDLTQKGIYVLTNMWDITESVLTFNFGKSTINANTEDEPYYLGKFIALDGFINTEVFNDIMTGGYDENSYLYLPTDNIQWLLGDNNNALIVIVKDNTVEVRLSGHINAMPS